MQEGDLAPLGTDAWGEAQLAFPEGKFENVLTGEKYQSTGKVSVAEILASFPVALLVRRG